MDRLDLYYIETEKVDPYHNLALEELLLNHVPKNGVILYLWQNQNTVVIGKNQNAWKECKIREIEKDGGFVARRPSGGGAVFHDLGNLNFTFLTEKKHYDVEKQLKVIVEAVKSLGLPAEKSGRNDITVEGRKFSGNAFYHLKENAYHHGTLLIDTDVEKLSRYLQVSLEKMKAKGVDSVRSRVVNLKTLREEITVPRMKEALKKAFLKVYEGETLRVLKETDLDQKEWDALTEKYSSYEWRLGRELPFTLQLKKRFPWGGVELQIKVEKGKIAACKVYSDAMDTVFIEKLADCFQGKQCSTEILIRELKRLYLGFTKEEMAMAEDMIRMFQENPF